MEKNLEKSIEYKFDSEPFYGDNDKYIKTKVKTYDSNVNTNFQGKKEPPENASYKSVINNARFCCQIKKYYPQTLQEEYKYEIKNNKMENLIHDDLDTSSSGNQTGNENNDECGNDESKKSDNDQFFN